MTDLGDVQEPEATEHDCTICGDDCDCGVEEMECEGCSSCTDFIEGKDEEEEDE